MLFNDISLSSKNSLIKKEKREAMKYLNDLHDQIHTQMWEQKDKEISNFEQQFDEKESKYKAKISTLKTQIQTKNETIQNLEELMSQNNIKMDNWKGSSVKNLILLTSEQEVSHNLQQDLTKHPEKLELQERCEKVSSSFLFNDFLVSSRYKVQNDRIWSTQKQQGSRNQWIEWRSQKLANKSWRKRIDTKKPWKICF